MPNPPELLSPAGSPEKLRFAFRYGADAVYLAGRGFNMRAAAENFSPEEIAEAVRTARFFGGRVYLALNTFPTDADMAALPDFLDAVAPAGVDAVICADLGMLSLVKKRLPSCAVHVSTQANVMNAAAARAWHELGAKRIILAREPTLEQIKYIRENTPPELEIECFVHGAMCVSYSGRCGLSAYFSENRHDANRGECKQPCRWNYQIYEEKRLGVPSLSASSEDDGEGAHAALFSSRDMCMLAHIGELISAGINAFKIEGRMKSAYYAAVTANAYRSEIDRYMRGPAGFVPDPAWMRELESVSRREYCTGFYFGSPHESDSPDGRSPSESAQICRDSRYAGEKSFLAAALYTESETGMAVFAQRNKVYAGQTAEIITPGKTGTIFTVPRMFDMEGKEIDSCPHPGMRFKMRLPFDVKQDDILRGAARGMRD